MHPLLHYHLGKYWLANEVMIFMNDEVIQIVTAHWAKIITFETFSRFEGPNFESFLNNVSFIILPDL